MKEFTLMIADDEKIIRDGLLQSIDWKMIGFQIVSIAKDGEEAIELFQQYKPQVVITDIKMPVKNGLEVLEYIKVEQPSTEVILLSGYDDFAYAKKGIKEGVFDYIMKINMFTELEVCLRKLHSSLMNKQKDTDHLLELKNNYMFSEYIRGRNPIELNGSEFVRNYCVVSIWMSPKHEINYDLIANHSFSLQNVMGVEHHYIHFVFYRRVEEPHQLINRLEHEVSTFIQCLENDGITEYRVGIGSIKRMISDIPNSYSEAMKTVDYLRYRDSESSVLLYNDWKGEGTSVEFKMSSITNWVNWVYSGDETNLVRWVEKVFLESSMNKKINLTDIQYLCMQILTQFEKAADDSALKAVTIAGSIEKLNEFDSLRDLENFFVKIIKEQCRNLHQRIQHHKNKSIAAVKEYIDQMYMTNLRLEDVAQHFFFSSGYLSAKFKDFTGMSFSKYVITKRIETACQLLAGTELKIYQIANQVGYSDEKHFSKLFTQYHKISPREYRTHHSL